MAFGTMNERGEPRVAPLDGVFIRGRFTVSPPVGERRAYGICAATPPAAPPTWTAMRSASSSMATRRSSSRRRRRRRDRADLARIYGWSPFEWGEGVVFMRIEPTSMWTYASTPRTFPSSDRRCPVRRMPRAVSLGNESAACAAFPSRRNQRHCANQIVAAAPLSLV